MTNRVLGALFLAVLFGGFFLTGCSDKKDDSEAASDMQKKEKKQISTGIEKTATQKSPSAPVLQVENKKTQPQVSEKKKSNNVPAESFQPSPQERKVDGISLDDFFKGLNLPEVIATVGDSKITSKELKNEIRIRIPPVFRGKTVPSKMLAQIQDNLHLIVKSMVNRRVLLDLAAADGIKPSPETLLKRFDKYVAGLSPEKKRIFEQQLKSQGSSLKQLRKDTADDASSQAAVAIDIWIDKKLMPELKVADADVEKYYREHQENFKKPETMKVAHILISPERPSISKFRSLSQEDRKNFKANADKKAEKKAEELLSQLKSGADFAKLAEKESVCPSKKEGGVLPEFDRLGRMQGSPGGRLDKAFAEAAFKLKPGELSGVVKTPYGYHIIKALEHHKESYIPFKEVKGYLKDLLQKKKLKDKIKTLVDAEKERRKVTFYLKSPSQKAEPETETTPEK